MTQVWLAYNHAVHYLVDTDTGEVVESQLPGWVNTFSDPITVWTEDGDIDGLVPDSVQDKAIEILETYYPMPDAVWN